MMDNRKTVTAIINEVCDEMCRSYCKYPDQYADNHDALLDPMDRLIDDHCFDCPLNRLGATG